MNHEQFVAKLRKNPDFVEAENELRFHDKLADAVLYARTEKGWSQTELAKLVQTRQANISRIEAAHANPTLDLIRRLCDVLDIDMTFTGPIVVETYKTETTTADLTEEYIRIDDDADNIFCQQYRTINTKPSGRGELV